MTTEAVILTEKCADDAMVVHVSPLVGVGDLEEDDRTHFDADVDRRRHLQVNQEGREEVKDVSAVEAGAGDQKRKRKRRKPIKKERQQ